MIHHPQLHTTAIPPSLRMTSSPSTAFRHLIRHLSVRRPPLPSLRFTSAVTVRAFSSDETNTEIPINGEKVVNKPPICTADELHYVSVKNSDWRLALWRYCASPQAISRKHPLLLLSGVGTNAIGYDLSPESSFARHMCEQGFDTWILEVRGAGLSMQATNLKEIEQSAHEISNQMEAVASSESLNINGTVTIESKAYRTNQQPTVLEESVLVTKLTETLITLSNRVSGFLSESQSRLISAKLFDQFSKLVGDSFLAERFNEIRNNILSLLEGRQDSGAVNQIRDLSQKLINIIEEGQRPVSPPLFDLQGWLNATMEDFQKQLDMIVKFNWDFDHYLEEDVPAAMEYIKAHTQPEDGKLVAVGHSMGGILLYSMLSRYGSEGRDPGLAAVVTLASSLDYTSSKSTLKLLLPLADPAQALNVPIVPLGAMLTAAYPFTSRPPYVLSWLNHMISAGDMMHPDLLKKLVLNNFCTIPAKLLLQLASALRERGLCDRSGTFFYKDHINKINIPVLAIAGDQDAICPPEAVQETVKLIPENLVTYKLFGEPDGPHYAHYDLVGGRLAVDEVYPCVIEFLSVHDQK
ncbi:putative alpha/beta hydrolase-1 [Helianthus annuus]|nr:putative alpha/beta hydrolase-1 [Helianthus annuus]